MAEFPSYVTIGLRNPLDFQIRFKTLKSKFDDLGKTQHKQKWLYPKYNINLVYEYITKSQIETLWEFYLARKGSYEAFNFFIPEPESTYPTYTGIYIGTGDGTTETFNLPCKTSSNRTVYHDALPYEEDVEYNFTAGGGEDGADKIDFSDSSMTAPANGVRLTMDFTGILKIRCRFMEDILNYSMFWDRVASSKLILEGFLNDE